MKANCPVNEIFSKCFLGARSPPGCWGTVETRKTGLCPQKVTFWWWRHTIELSVDEVST